MNLKEIEKVVGMIQSHIFKNSNDYSSGLLKSHFRGSGLQFREHQVYVPGDDVRFIDWKLSARSSNVYIKTFEEERNVEIVVFLDLSPTLLYGFNNISKLQAMIEIIALLYLIAAENNDVVRVIIFKDKIINLPPKNGKEGLTHFVSFLEKSGIITANGKVNLNPDVYHQEISEMDKIKQIKIFLGKKKEIIFLSDFNNYELVNDWVKLLERKNMHGFRVFSPLDEGDSFPYFLKIRDIVSKKSSGIFLKSKQNLAHLTKKEKLHSIGVQDRYLEKFLRELI